MEAKVLAILVTIYAVHVLAKFAFFFLLRYGSRRKALERAYAGKASATKRADAMLLAFQIVLIACWRFGKFR